MKDFKSKVAVITGAASGFGREFAFCGARQGMRLVLADLQQDRLDEVKAKLEAQGTQVLAMRCDVRKAAQVQALADAAMDRFGTVHMVFNNAGVGAGGLIWEHSIADWEWVLGVNLWGVIHGVRVFTPLMLECAKNEEHYEGHITNTASFAGLLNAPNLGIYNVSKHAAVSLSETLYHDLQLIQAPIGVSVLCPYFVPTGISQSHHNRPDDVKENAELTTSQLAARTVVDKAVSAGKVTAAEVAEISFDAIKEGRFYIYSHPHALASVRTRMDDIIEQRNPTDPYEGVPQFREMLLAKMRLSS